MAIYLYRNHMGAERTIEYPMKEMGSHMEAILVDERGNWKACNAGLPDSCELFRRVFTVPRMAIEADQSVDYDGQPPVSKSLPRRKMMGAVEENYHGMAAFRHKDGALTNATGQPIIDSKAAMQRECSRTGMVRGRGEETE